MYYEGSTGPVMAIVKNLIVFFSICIIFNLKKDLFSKKEKNMEGLNETVRNFSCKFSFSCLFILGPFLFLKNVYDNSTAHTILLGIVIAFITKVTSLLHDYSVPDWIWNILYLTGAYKSKTTLHENASIGLNISIFVPSITFIY